MGRGAYSLPPRVKVCGGKVSGALDPLAVALYHPGVTNPLLAEQIAYYRATADEYEDHGIPGGGEDELHTALDDFGPAGDVLELAGGSLRILLGVAWSCSRSPVPCA